MITSSLAIHSTNDRKKLNKLTGGNHLAVANLDWEFNGFKKVKVNFKVLFKSCGTYSNAKALILKEVVRLEDNITLKLFKKSIYFT